MKCFFKIIICSFLLCSPLVLKSSEKGRVVSEDIKNILDENGLGGVILLFDAQQEVFYSNNFEKSSEYELPASTFKIPNTIIGLETGVIKSKNSIFKWTGDKREFSFWEQDLTVKDAFHMSCVPCYQKLALDIGFERMVDYLTKLKFGEMDVSVENLDNFWLRGKSKITPFQQIDFLKRLYYDKLPISKQAAKEIKEILVIKKREDYVLSGKTGFVISNSEKEVGWFVGYVEKGQGVFFFATKVCPNKKMSRKHFLGLRQRVTLLALKKNISINKK